MRIDPNLTVAGAPTAAQRVGRQEPGSGRASVADSAQAQRTDRAVLSERAQDVLVAQRALQSMPDIRSDRVEAVRQKLATGTFQVDAAQIVDKLMGGAA